MVYMYETELLQKNEIYCIIIKSMQKCNVEEEKFLKRRYLKTDEGKQLRVSNRNITLLCKKLTEKESSFKIEYKGLTSKELEFLEKFPELMVEWPYSELYHGKIHFGGVIYKEK